MPPVNQWNPGSWEKSRNELRLRVTVKLDAEAIELSDYPSGYP